MISYVFFDVGGVVIDDFSGNHKWAHLKQELGINVDLERRFNELFHRYNREFCTDRDVETFLPILESELGVVAPAGYSFLEAFVDRFSANPDIVPAIKLVRDQVGVGLLTNMYPRMFDDIQRRQILPDIVWDHVVDSSVVRLQKPDPEMFAHAQQVAGVPGDQILFVDNSLEHVAAAKAHGWQAYHYDSSDHRQSSQRLADHLKRQSFRRKRA